MTEIDRAKMLVFYLFNLGCVRSVYRIMGSEIRVCLLDDYYHNHVQQPSAEPDPHLLESLSGFLRGVPKANRARDSGSCGLLKLYLEVD